MKYVSEEADATLQHVVFGIILIVVIVISVGFVVALIYLNKYLGRKKWI